MIGGKKNWNFLFLKFEKNLISEPAWNRDAFATIIDRFSARRCRWQSCYRRTGFMGIHTEWTYLVLELKSVASELGRRGYMGILYFHPNKKNWGTEYHLSPTPNWKICLQRFQRLKLQNLRFTFFKIFCLFLVWKARKPCVFLLVDLGLQFSYPLPDATD